MNPLNFIGLNVSGGLLPIVLALYQFQRAPILAILGVSAIVAVISYFLVTVISGRGIFVGLLRFLLISSIAAVSALPWVAGGDNRLDTSVAFAGGVLGTTIGGDLFYLKDVHLKDVHFEDAENPLSVGGAGLDDLIAASGFYALIIAEWLPAAISWLSGYFT